MNNAALIQSLGFTLPSPAYIAGAIAFGLVGMAAYAIGKRTGKSQTKWIGVALMLYPYVISETWMLYAVGTLLSAALLIKSD